MTRPADGPNAEQVRYWNETAAPKWIAWQEVLDAQLESLGRRTMDAVRIATGDRVLDVGCGCGATTREIARRVAPGGRVVGVDVSAPMLERAAELTRAAGLADVRFEHGDAQTHRFEPGAFDVLFSRFGVMFFADPVAAFRNLRGALRPGGRLGFICWQAIWENPWVTVPLGAAAQHVQLPPPPEPGAPGPFAFADADRVRGILTDAGFQDVAFADVRETLSVGDGDLDRAVDFLANALGPTSAVLREADPAVKPRVMAAMRDAMAPFVDGGRVCMPSAAWIVTGRA